MTERDKDIEALDALFDAAKGAEAADDAFLARLMTDATEAAEKNATRQAPSASPSRASFWHRWLPATGLTAATLTGVWIGMVLPESDLGTAYLADAGYGESGLVDFVPSLGLGPIAEDDG